MFKKIEKKDVFTKDSYLETIAAWKWFITSGGAKARGYILPEYAYDVNFKRALVRIQKHKASSITCSHMILNNLIRGRDPWKGFADKSLPDYESLAANNTTYREASTAIMYSLQTLNSTAERIGKLDKGRDCSFNLDQYAAAAQYLTDLGRPFGLNWKEVKRILDKATS